MPNQPVRETVSDFIRKHNQSQFTIPIYQKNYTWQADNETQRFVEDIKLLLRGEQQKHFMGLMIYRFIRDESQIVKYEIVDGQQRLTTIYLFLLSLQLEAMKQNDSQTRQSINTNYLYLKQDSFLMRFIPAITGQRIFTKIAKLMSDNLTWQEKQTNIYKNYAYIRGEITKLLATYSFRDLLGVLDKMEIITLGLDEEDDTQQIFEAINLPGSLMTFTDRLRDFIFMNLKPTMQEYLYDLYWKPFEEIFKDSESMLNFARGYLAMKTYSLPDRNRAYDAFKMYWHRVSDPIERKLSDLYGCALSYLMIYNGPGDDEIVENALVGYRIGNHKEPAPVLMEIIHRYRMGEVNSQLCANCIKLLDTYMSRRLMIGLDNKILSNWFPTILKPLKSHFKDENNGLYYALRELLLTPQSPREISHGMPSDKQLRNALRTTTIYNNTRATRMLLERLEMDSSSVKVDMSGLNIEHIMPVHPTPYWKDASGCKDDGEYNLIANMLGNLTLADESDNLEMGNDTFQQKKRVLQSTSHIHLNADILQQSSWNKKTILQRCNLLTERLLKIYPYPEKETVEAKNVTTRVIVPVKGKGTVPLSAKGNVIAHVQKESETQAVSQNTQPQQDKVKVQPPVQKESQEKLSFVAQPAPALPTKQPQQEVIKQDAGKSESVQLPKTQKDLYYNKSQCKVHALYKPDGTVTILAGSLIKTYATGSMKTMQKLYQELIAKGVLSERKNQTAIFKTNHTFTDLLSASSFVSQRGGDNREIWQSNVNTTYPAPEDKPYKPKGMHADLIPQKDVVSTKQEPSTTPKVLQVSATKKPPVSPKQNEANEQEKQVQNPQVESATVSLDKEKPTQVLPTTSKKEETKPATALKVQAEPVLKKDKQASESKKVEPKTEANETKPSVPTTPVDVEQKQEKSASEKAKETDEKKISAAEKTAKKKTKKSVSKAKTKDSPAASDKKTEEKKDVKPKEKSSSASQEKKQKKEDPKPDKLTEQTEEKSPVIVEETKQKEISDTPVKAQEATKRKRGRPKKSETTEVKEDTKKQKKKTEEKKEAEVKKTKASAKKKEEKTKTKKAGKKSSSPASQKS